MKRTAALCWCGYVIGPVVPFCFIILSHLIKYRFGKGQKKAMVYRTGNAFAVKVWDNRSNRWIFLHETMG